MSYSDQTEHQRRSSPSRPHAAEEGGVFCCAACGLSEQYESHSRTPRFLRSVVFLEECYVRRNPFVARGAGDAFLVLGGECTACGRTVCQGQQCSVFYSKRFCMDCAKANIEEFPPEVQAKLN